MARVLKNWPFWLFGLIVLAASLVASWGEPQVFPHSNHLAPLSSNEEGHFFLLGTTPRGKDLFQAILYGSGFSIWLGLLTTLLIGIIGLGVGMLMGYYYKKRGQTGPFALFFLLVGGLVGYFYGFGLRKFQILDAADESIFGGLGQILLGCLIFLLIGGLFYTLGKKLDQRFGLRWSFAMGEGMTWLLQVLDSLPTLLLILTLMAIFQDRSLVLVMVLIALTSWSRIALLARGQVLKESELPYVEAARMLGMTDLRIFRRHLLPNILPSVAVVLALAVGRIILVESSLGFLGLIDDYEGLGGLLSRSRGKPDYPWLGIFPGFMLALIILLIHQIGERLKVFE